MKVLEVGLIQAVTADQKLRPANGDRSMRSEIGAEFEAGMPVSTVVSFMKSMIKCV